MTTPNVNVPTNDKQKEADINQKTQLYGIGQAFALGKAPSNKQIDVAMNSALANKTLASPSKQLSADGRQLIGDLRDVIEQAKMLFLTKNEGNMLQDFVWQCQGIGSGNAQKPGAPIDKDTAKQHGNEALEDLRTLGQLLITNGQFRKLLQDGLVLARDIAGDGAQKAADNVNPSEDELKQIDEPAEENTWHEAPDFKGMKEKAQSSMQRGKEQAKVAGQQAQDATKTAQQQEGTTGGMAQNLKERAAQTADANIPEDKKQEAQEKRDHRKEQVKNYVDEKMPKERREQIIYRLKKMIVEVQGQQDYQSAIDSLLRLAEEYQGHTKTVAGDATNQAKGAHSGNGGLNAAEADLRIILERFANNTSMDDIFDSINAIYRDADRDPELKGFFRSLDKYIRKCLKEQGYVLKDEATEEWNKLYDQGNFLLRDRYKNHGNRVADEFKFFGQQFDNDPQNKRFAESMNKLFADLGQDKNGKPEFKPHLLRDLRDVIIPDIINSIRYVPVPDIEFTSTDADLVIRDLVLEADNIIPNIIDINSDNHFRYGRKGVQSSNKNKFQIHVSGIQTHLTNVRFYNKVKKGLKIRNWGLMDITLADTGLDFLIKMETADKSDGAHFFKVTDVDVKIKNLKLNFKEQHHPILTKVAAMLAKGPLLSGPIKKVLEAKIKQSVSDLDAFCYSIYQDVQKAKESAKRNPDQAQNVFKQYFDAYQAKMLRQKREGERKKEEAKKKAQEKEVQTNIAFLKEQRISKNWNNGKGIPIDEQEKNPSSGAGKFTLKTQEYMKLAHDGKDWESPVFSIGSAKETTGLPTVGKISRKPHETAPSEIRGKNNLSDSERSNIAGGSNSGYTSSPPSNAMATGAGVYGQSGLGGYGAGQGTPATLGQQPDGMYSTTNGGIRGIDDKSGTAGTSNLGPSGVGPQTANTTLGTSNPVLSGRV